MNLLTRFLAPFRISRQAASMSWQLAEYSYPIGHDLTFSVEFIGGLIDQHVDNVQVTLVCQLDEVTGNLQPEQIDLLKVNIDKNFFIRAQQTLKKFYSIHLPKHAPMSNNICGYFLELKLNTATSTQQELTSAITIGPSEQMAVWFKLIEQLGFTQQAYWNQPLNNTSSKFPYQQKFRFRKKNFVASKSLDIIFRFEQFSDYLDVFVEAFIANQAQSANHTSHVFRFTIDKTDPACYQHKLLEQLEQSK